VGTEIERKFLVRSDDWRTSPGTRLRQGYLNPAKERTVRVRVAADQAVLTIKGPAKGLSRPEFEYPIPVADAEQLLLLCEGPVLDKVRHLVVHHGTRWEVDEFFGENRGLVIAEVELSREDETFERPPWLGTEVTGDARYYNSSLSERPYASWRDDNPAR
jgi:adenylate cyclase